MSLPQSEHEGMDQAVAGRRGKLGGMPVDTSRLDAAVRAEIGVKNVKEVNQGWRILRPLSAMAASLVLVAVLAVALMQGRPAVASPAIMAQMHRDIVSGQVPTMRADSLDDVNKAFAAFASGLPTLNAPSEMLPMACCMRNVGNKKVACVLLNDGGTPVTLAVADLGAVETPVSAPVTHKGGSFYVQNSGELNMVMLDRKGHRICLIGNLSPERLMALTDGLKF